MSGSTLRHFGMLAASLSAAPLARAQVLVQRAEEPGLQVLPGPDIATLAGLGGLVLLFVLGVVAVSLYHDRVKRRERIGLAEKLVASGQAVPPELLVGETPSLPLPEERRRDVRRGITLLAWAIAVALIPIIGSGGQWRYGVWGLLFLLPSLGSFLKAHLTAREIARRASNGSPQR